MKNAIAIFNQAEAEARKAATAPTSQNADYHMQLAELYARLAVSRAVIETLEEVKTAVNSLAS